jgi:Sulfotransferase domain
MLASLGEKLAEFDLLATGLPQQVEIFEHVIARTGRPPPVLDSADLLQRPEPMLRALCDALGVPFSNRMLSWPAGRRATDGIWARHWYDRVEQSTGFESPPSLPSDGPPARSPAVAAIEAQCRPLYEKLRAHRLRA